MASQRLKSRGSSLKVFAGSVAAAWAWLQAAGGMKTLGSAMPSTMSVNMTWREMKRSPRGHTEDERHVCPQCTCSKIRGKMLRNVRGSDGLFFARARSNMRGAATCVAAF